MLQWFVPASERQLVGLVDQNVSGALGKWLGNNRQEQEGNPGVPTMTIATSKSLYCRCWIIRGANRFWPLCFCLWYVYLKMTHYSSLLIIFIFISVSSPPESPGFVLSLTAACAGESACNVFRLIRRLQRSSKQLLLHLLWGRINCTHAWRCKWFVFAARPEQLQYHPPWMQLFGSVRQVCSLLYCSSLCISLKPAFLSLLLQSPFSGEPHQF